MLLAFFWYSQVSNFFFSLDSMSSDMNSCIQLLTNQVQARTTKIDLNTLEVLAYCGSG